MKLTTCVTVAPSSDPIPLGAETLALGSCFAQRVGGKLAEHLFPTAINPYGMAYNPLALAEQLSSSSENPRLFLHDGLWRSLNHHSEVAGNKAHDTLARLARAREEMGKALLGSKLLLLTFGTATAFEHRLERRVVASCHRLPQALFRQRRVGLEEAAQALLPVLQRYLEGGEHRRVILTVSPVRYLRQGLVENSRSKAVLLLLTEQLAAVLPRTEYFPSYEILHDELRDYRFYSDDLAQPSQLALEIVWERFCQAYFSERDRSALELIARANDLAAHRLSENSSPGRLAERGLSLLSRLNQSAPHVCTERLRVIFEGWLSDRIEPSLEKLS